MPLDGDDSSPYPPEKLASGSGLGREMDLLLYDAPSIRNLFSELLHSPSPHAHLLATSAVAAVLRALLGSLSQGVSLRGRQTIQSCVEGVGGT